MSLTMVNPSNPVGVIFDTVPAGIISACTGFMNTSRTIDTCKLSMIKFNLIGTDGHYVDKNNSVLHELIPPAHGASESSVAPQLALAISLRTAARRGLAHAGRIYMPVPVCPVGGDGRVSVAERAPYITHATSFLDALNAAGEGWVVGVVSNVREGGQRRVTNVRVGRVLDTIRSRRTSLDEDYLDGAALAEA